MRPLGRGAATLALAVLFAACADVDVPAADEPQPTGPGEPAAACGPIVEPPIEGGGHLVGDNEPPVPYGTTPPTSGWHVSGTVDVSVRGHEDALREPEQVTALEMGAVVVTWHGLDDDDRRALEDLVRERYPERVTTTPYDALDPGQVAFSAWGVKQVCEGVDLDALAAFVEGHAAPPDEVEGHDHGG